METCAHPPCTCRHDRDEMVEQGQSLYCSSGCARQDPGSDGCGCDHPECEG